jgi:hypothetical protein
MVRLDICEWQHVIVEILSLFYPLIVPIVTQYLFRPEAFFSIWRHVTVSWWRVITSPNVQHGGPSRVGCPRLLVPYIPSYLPHLEAMPSIHKLRTRRAGSWTLKEEHKPRLFKNTSRVLTNILGLTYVISPWSRLLPEKLTNIHLVKIFPAFYGTRSFITAFTSARQLSLSWAR